MSEMDNKLGEEMEKDEFGGGTGRGVSVISICGSSGMGVEMV